MWIKWKRSLVETIILSSTKNLEVNFYIKCFENLNTVPIYVWPGFNVTNERNVKVRNVQFLCFLSVLMTTVHLLFQAALRKLYIFEQKV